jgi:molybdate transport system substrate-binding protein
MGIIVISFEVQFAGLIDDYSYVELMMQVSFHGCLGTFLLLNGMLVSTVFAGEINAAVEASFAEPMERIVALYQKTSGNSVKVNLDSGGKLYTQIKNGAAYDIVISADEAMPKRLVQEGMASGDTRFVFAAERLVLWSAIPDFVDAKGAVLFRGNFNKLAIADPKLSSYGMASKETLEKLVMWNSIQAKLVKGENENRAYQLAASENADLAFTGLSQIMREGKITGGSWWLVPPEIHGPVRQSAVMLTNSKNSAEVKQFLDFLKSKKVEAIIRNFGYELP